MSEIGIAPPNTAADLSYAKSVLADAGVTHRGVDVADVIVVLQYLHTAISIALFEYPEHVGLRVADAVYAEWRRLPYAKPVVDPALFERTTAVAEPRPDTLGVPITGRGPTCDADLTGAHGASPWLTPPVTAGG